MLMQNPQDAVTRGADLIAYIGLKFAGQDYLPGDRFDYRSLELADPRRVRAMVQGGKLAELTRASMTLALRRRRVATWPAGFTMAELVTPGILTEDEALAQNPTELAPWAPGPDAWQVEGADHVWIVPKFNGASKVPFFRLFLGDGTLLNEGKQYKSKPLAGEAAVLVPRPPVEAMVVLSKAEPGAKVDGEAGADDVPDQADGSGSGGESNDGHVSSGAGPGPGSGPA